MNYYGLILGLAAFFLVGLSHPLVIKAEYYYGKRIWWMFLVVGILFSIASCLVTNSTTSIVLGVTGFSFFWSTHEMFKQHKRVIEGRAKRNPNREYK
jgi:hypothetical protein